MSKWQKIDPAEIKVGDRVRMVDNRNWALMAIMEGTVTEVRADQVFIGYVNYNCDPPDFVPTWYVRKPKKAKPPTRPDEPPVGSFFRVDRTGGEFLSIEPNGDYVLITPGSDAGTPAHWDYVVKPGDTITMLKLVEDWPPTTVHYPRPYGEDTQ